MPNNPFYLVGLVGYKQSGKDTVAGMLRKHFPGLAFVRVGFADALKDEVCAKLKCTREFLETNKAEFREYLQHHGQLAKEERGQLVWVQKVAEQINFDLPKDKPTLIVISDVRFPFEADWIREIGGTLVKIDRFEGTTDPHPSETEIDKIQKIEFRIPNKGTIRDLEREVYWVSGFLKERWKLI